MSISPSISGKFHQIHVVAPLLLTLVLLSACGGVPELQQQASQDQAQLDSQLQHARDIGVPGTLLQSVQVQEAQLRQSSAPLDLFSNQPASDYYHNLAARYTMLRLQVQGIIASTTDNAQTQAQRDVRALQMALAQHKTSGLPAQIFEQQLKQYQIALATTATYPKDYAAISAEATATMQNLHLMQSNVDRLHTLQTAIDQMRATRIDVTAIQAQFQSDQQTLASAQTEGDLQQLSTQIEAQYQQAVVQSTLSLPYVTAARLQEFAQQVQLLQIYGIDASAYRKRLDADRAIMSKTLNAQDYAVFSKQIDADIAAMHSDLIHGEAAYLVKQFHSEAENWARANAYHDSYDGLNYPLNAGYLSAGIGSDLDLHLSWALTTADFQAVVDEANNDLFSLHMLEADFKDHTPYNQIHSADLQLLQHYNLQQGQVIVVSFVEQAMRIYQGGKLVRAFHVTTGRAELPALPGVWPVQDRLSPTTFRSAEPPGSPYWYPDTAIHYAILYHSGGYFIHDSWWRADYGPGTQFPHVDSGGDAAFSNNGSHGCINMQLDQAAWVYNNTDWRTEIVIY